MRSRIQIESRFFARIWHERLSWIRTLRSDKKVRLTWSWTGVKNTEILNRAKMCLTLTRKRLSQSSFVLLQPCGSDCSSPIRRKCTVAQTLTSIRRISKCAISCSSSSILASQSIDFTLWELWSNFWQIRSHNSRWVIVWTPNLCWISKTRKLICKIISS